MAFRDRKDGKRITNLDGMHGLIPHVMPKRCDADVYINQKFDVTNLVKYVEKKNKNASEEDRITYFHAFFTALGKLVYNREKLNRFVINKKFYQRNDVSISFVAKTGFTDDAEEFFTLIKVDEKDNINTLSKKVKGNVQKIRNSKRNNADDVINFVGKLPTFLKSIIWGTIKFLDRHDLLPSSLTNDTIYYSTILVSNLGSIDCDAIYHHLTDFGTNSILITIGKIKKEVVIIDGKEQIRDIVEFGAAVDERIGDGYYFVKSMKLLQKIFDSPELLEEDANEKIEETNK